MKPAVTAGQRVSHQKSVKPSAGAAVSGPEPRSRAQQVVPDRAYVRRDLIRVGIVAGISILILIILRLAL
jgi:hypothetical protein